MTLRVTEVSPITGEVITMDNGEQYIRYSADNWTWLIGESIETCFSCSKQEEAYQVWKSSPNPGLQRSILGKVKNV